MSSKEFLDTVHDPEGSVITHIKNVASDMVKSIEKMEAEVKEVELKEVESEKIEGNE
jgi:hypothetical protein